KAKIEEAKLYKISELFRKKPRGLSIGITDAIVIDVKPEKGKTVKETLYARLKADGTFTTSVLGDARLRNERLANFLKQYIAKDVTKYNVKENIGKWKGKSVEVVPYKDGGYIYIP
ncbi:MAG: hypothetical protein QMC80_08630, partial [Thermoplasmatales archaeon]|nr:hypothetical protein [Thermoplasmatales archaeon]